MKIENVIKNKGVSRKKGEEYKPPELPQPKQTTPSNPNPLTTAAQRAAQKAARKRVIKELRKK